MPFSVTIDSNDFYQDLKDTQQINGVTFNPQDISDAIRFSIRHVMRQYSVRVNTFTKHWKLENIPVFVSNFSEDRQLGLTALEARPVEFTLQNTRVWGLVSAGSPPHIIESRGFWPLRFTGWPNRQRGRSGRSRAEFESRHPRQRGSPLSGSFTYAQQQRRQTYGRQVRTTRNQPRARRLEERGGIGSGSRSPYSIVGYAVDAISRTRESYPPTYVSSTKPLIYASNKSQNVGTETVYITAPFGQNPSVNHPGFESRNLTGMLLGHAGNVRGGPLSDLFTSTVFNLLGLDNEDGVRVPSLRRPFVVETRSGSERGQEVPSAGRVQFAISRFLRENKDLAEAGSF